MTMKSTPQSGSRAPYTEPVYTKNAATIQQKLANNKGKLIDGDIVFPGNTPSPTGGGGASRKSKKQGD